MYTHPSMTANARSRRILTAPRPSPRRRGLTSLLAMLYLVVFAALALGFYAQTNMSMQVSNNERRMKEARAAAEAGLQYIRYELSRVTLDPLLTDDQVFEELQMDMKGHVEELGLNLEAGDRVGDIVYDPAGINPPYFEIPANPARYIRLGQSDEGPWFRARFEQQGRDIVVTTVGKSANKVASSLGNRAGIQIRFQTKEWPNVVFTYGMASRNAVNISVAKLKVQGTPDSQASILSTYTGGPPVTIGNTSSTALEPTGIEGKITLVQGAPNPSYVGTNYSVGGLTTQAAINASITRIPEAPEWPTPDLSVFAKYATNLFVPGLTVYENIYIPSGTTTTFSSTHTLKGVILIKPGCNITFNGQVNMQCVIIGEPGGSLATNIIKFQGNALAKQPLSSLPDEPKWAELRKLDGTFLLAPGWDVNLSGSFQSIAGSIAADRITFTGNTSGSITGSLVNLGNYPMTIGGSSNITLAAPTADKRPGLRFTERFAPVKSSYKEIRPAPEAVALGGGGGGGEVVTPLVSTVTDPLPLDPTGLLPKL